MSKCALCWEIKSDGIDTRSLEANRLEVEIVLRKYFDFCFDEVNDNFTCRECWKAVSSFHDFFERIQAVHQGSAASNSIVVKTEVEDLDVDTADVWVEPRIEILDIAPPQIYSVDPSPPRESDDNSDEWHEKPVPTQVSEQKVGKKKKKISTKEKICNYSGCDFTCRSYHLLGIHKRKVHPEHLTGWTCDDCGKIFRVKRFLIKHMGFGHERVTCDICQSEMFKGALETHMNSRHRSSRIGYKKANGELIQVTRPLDQQTQEEAFEDGEIRPNSAYSCPVAECTRTFDNYKTMLRHIRWGHEVRECEICNKTVKSGNYTTHLKTVHNHKGLNVCELCGGVFKSLTGYKAHMVTQHTENEPVQCGICNAWFKNKIRLRNHHSVEHANPEQNKPAICKLCGAVSKNARYLKTHMMRSHDQSYKDRFLCAVCGFRSSNKTLYNEHAETHKSIRTRVKCEQCDKDFSSKRSLIAHYATHITTEKLTCPYCPRTYKYWDGVRHHVKKHHKAEDDIRKAAIEQQKLENLEKLRNQIDE